VFSAAVIIDDGIAVGVHLDPYKIEKIVLSLANS
jgi:hypothetical protein